MSLADAAVVVAVNALQDVFGDLGTFTAPPAAPVSCRIILSRQDEAISFGGLETQVRVPGWRAELPQHAVPTRPRVGTDTITVGAVTYAIRDVATDVERSVWVLDVIEAP